MQSNEIARDLFSGIAQDYDGPAEIFSLLQYSRWHRHLLANLPLPADGRVLDMATGTGAVALKLAERSGGQVMGADITRPMLIQAKARAARKGMLHRLEFIECSAEAVPFADSAFDTVMFTYLLRYVSDVPSTLRELARVLRPGGIMLSLDFAVPGPMVYPLWRLYTSLILPLAGAAVSPSWMKVGTFLGKSIRQFSQRWPEYRLMELWRDCGFLKVRSRRLSLGGALIMWGVKVT